MDKHSGPRMPTPKPGDEIEDRCVYVDKYKGFYRPKCFGGKGCKACWTKYAARHINETRR